MGDHFSPYGREGGYDQQPLVEYALSSVRTVPRRGSLFVIAGNVDAVANESEVDDVPFRNANRALKGERTTLRRMRGWNRAEIRTI